MAAHAVQVVVDSLFRANCAMVLGLKPAVKLPVSRSLTDEKVPTITLEPHHASHKSLAIINLL